MALKQVESDGGERTQVIICASAPRFAALFAPVRALLLPLCA